MGWIKKVPPPHQCALPGWDPKAGTGSLWKCDECGQVWKLNKHLWVKERGDFR